MVLSEAQRASPVDPVILKLIELIPRANLTDSSGTPRFIGSVNAPVNGDHWTIDITYNRTSKDRLHGYYALYRTLGTEPTRTGNTIPGFGNFVRAQRQTFTLNETHIFSPNVVNETANTLRPDANGPIEITGEVESWFDTAAFTPVERFGNLGRNVVIGPGFNTVDTSVIKNINLSERARLHLRLEVFDVFNHANFGPPGNVVGSPAFGRLTSTRFPTGESGSSRQIQFAMKISL